MVYTKVKIKDFKKESLVNFVLSLQGELSKFIDTLDQHIDNVTSTVENLSKKVGPCLMATKAVNSKLLKRVTSVEWNLHS